MKYNSQYGQDQWLNDHIFRNKRNGVFVDIGAHDGITINNTLFFEKHLGWTGICIEPIPVVYEKLKGNRTCDCVHGCIFDRDGEVLFQVMEGYTEMLSGIAESYNVRHLDRINREVGIHGGDKKLIKVPCHQLSTLLTERNITHVDYLTVDTEGSELEILEGINYDNVYIHVIDVEVNYEDDEQKIIQFLTSKGYRLLHKLGGDDIFVRT